MGHLAPDPRISSITWSTFPKRNPRFYKEGSDSFPKITHIRCSADEIAREKNGKGRRRERGGEGEIFHCSF
jgi:hypothetical protein